MEKIITRVLVVGTDSSHKKLGMSNADASHVHECSIAPFSYTIRVWCMMLREFLVDTGIFAIVCKNNRCKFATTVNSETTDFVTNFTFDNCTELLENG